MLNYPDFRSYERAFQLMAQVAGRAGRKNKQGLVILQTKSPDLPLIHEVVTNNYRSLFDEQIAERHLFKYPPFYRLVYVYLKHRKQEVLDQAADVMARYLRQGLGRTDFRTGFTFGGTYSNFVHKEDNGKSRITGVDVKSTGIPAPSATCHRRRRTFSFAVGIL